MRTKTGFALLAVMGLSLLASCAMNPHPMDMTQAVQSAKTRSDHESLAKHYEEAAKEMQIKVEEHKKALAHYEAYRLSYRRSGLYIVNHCQNLVRIYEQAVEENMSMAKSHRELAAEAN